MKGVHIGVMEYWSGGVLKVPDLDQYSAQFESLETLEPWTLK
jgi:hypothetical protein